MLSDQQHPSLYKIYANMDSDADPEVAHHIATCPECRRKAEEREVNRQAFLAEGPTPEEFADRVVEMVAKEDAAERRRLRRRYAYIFTGGVTVGIAAAAALLLTLGATRAPSPPSGLLTEVRYRGAALQFTAVRVRGSEQTRHASEFTARVGDQLNVEIDLDRPTRLSAGVLTEDGQWEPMFEDRLMAPGIHHSNSDSSPTVGEGADPGWVLVGPPERVREAIKKKTPSVDGVYAVRVVPEVGSRGAATTR